MLALEAQWLTRETKAVLFLDDGQIDIITSTVGADQGCSASPIVFAVGLRKALLRMRTRLEQMLAQGGDGAEPARAEILRIIGYLDDLLLVVPQQHALGATTAVRDELAAVGLSVNMLKSKVWIPDGTAPPPGLPVPAATAGSCLIR